MCKAQFQNLRAAIAIAITKAIVVPRESESALQRFIYFESGCRLFLIFYAARQRPLPEGWKRGLHFQQAHRRRVNYDWQSKPMSSLLTWFSWLESLFCIGSSDSVLHTELGFRVDLANNSRSVAPIVSPILLCHMHCRTDLIAFSHSKEFVRCFHDSITASAREKEISFDSARFSRFWNETRKIFFLLRVVIEFEEMKNWLLVSEGRLTQFIKCQ